METSEDRRQAEQDLERQFAEIASLVQCYDSLPYTPFRIKRILAELGCRMENIYQGYKANRRPGYCELYRIIRNTDGQIIHPCINLHTLRRFFARQGYHLTDQKSLAGAPANRSKQNPKAAAFPESVRHLCEGKKNL